MGESNLNSMADHSDLYLVQHPRHETRATRLLPHQTFPTPSVLQTLFTQRNLQISDLGRHRALPRRLYCLSILLALPCRCTSIEGHRPNECIQRLQRYIYSMLTYRCCITTPLTKREEIRSYIDFSFWDIVSRMVARGCSIYLQYHTVLAS